jgi:hypothetical protein
MASSSLTIIRVRRRRTLPAQPRLLLTRTKQSEEEAKKDYQQLQQNGKSQPTSEPLL